MPRIANWSDLQEVEPEFPFTVTWNPFTNGTTSDYVLLEISEPGNGSAVFSTPGLVEADPLNGTNVSFEVPGDLLTVHHTYDARLLFVKASDLVRTNFTGATGLGGFYRQTRFSIATLPDGPAAGRIQFSSRNFVAGEDAGHAVVTITRSGNEGSTTVNLTTGNGTALEGADYSGWNQTITLDTGVAATNILIPVLDDFLLEGNETFNLTLSAPTGGAVLGSRSNAVVTILDNEIAKAGVVGFIRTAYSGLEKSKSVILTLKRSGGSTGTVTVNYHTANGTAGAGSDYVATNGTVTFAPKAVTASLAVPILNDALDETNETFFIVLDESTGGAALGTNLIATVSIKDDDTAGSIALSSAAYSTNENGGQLLVSLKRAGGVAGGVTVDYAAQNGVALAGQDYGATAGTLSFRSNELTKVISIPILQDTLAEGNETFAIRLFNPTGGATLGAITNALLTIVDDESSVTFTNAAYTVTEAGPAISFVVVRSGALISPVSVVFSTQNGTAVAPGDYAGTNLTLTFPANISSRTVIVPIVNNTLPESTETFQATLSNPQGGVQLGTITSATVTITDNDFPGTIQFSAASYSVTEGTANATILVTRTGGASSGVTVQFATTTGSAIAGSDYTAVSTNLTFAAGETNKSVQISITADSLDESTETVNLVLRNPTGGATLGAQTAAVLSVLNKPDPNAVPITGPVFMSGTIAGKPFNIGAKPALGQHVTAAIFTGGIGMNLVASSASGGVIRLIVIDPRPFSVGTYNLDNNGTHGLMNYSETTFSGTGRAWSVADGSASVNSFGTFTYDAIDTVNKMVSGRFKFHARETTDGVQPNGGFIEIIGSFRCHYQQ